MTCGPTDDEDEDEEEDEAWRRAEPSYLLSDEPSSGRMEHTHVKRCRPSEPGLSG